MVQGIAVIHASPKATRRQLFARPRAFTHPEVVPAFTTAASSSTKHRRYHRQDKMYLLPNVNKVQTNFPCKGLTLFLKILTYTYT